MKNLKTFENWFSSKKEEDKSAVKSAVKPEGSDFNAELAMIDGSMYYIYDNRYSKHPAYVVKTSPKGDLILSSSDGTFGGDLIDNKRIKVPSIEKALMYLTKLKKEQDLIDNEDKNHFDEEID